MDYVRNGICRDNLVHNISTEGNEAYFEDGEYDLCAGGIYVDGGQNIEIFNNFIFNCDIGLEVATEHSPDDNELFKVSGIHAHDNVIADCTGWSGITFGGYEKTLVLPKIVYLIITLWSIISLRLSYSATGKTGSAPTLSSAERMEFSLSLQAGKKAWSTRSAEMLPPKSQTRNPGPKSTEHSIPTDQKQPDGFRSLIEDTGSRFVPDEEQIRIYKAQKIRKRWNLLKEKVKSWFDHLVGADTDSE